MTNCPRKIRLFGSLPPKKSLPNAYCFLEYKDLLSNSANLKRVECVPGIVVPLQLLAGEEDIACGYIGACKTGFNSGNNPSVCHIDFNKFAHFYIIEKNPTACINHYIIAFVEAKYIGNYNALVNILHDTVKVLKIANKRPYFYIYYYGNRPAINLNLSDIRTEVTRQLRRILNNYAEKESFCRIHTAEYNCKNFTINRSNPYELNYS